LIGAEGAKTHAGEACQGRPRRSVSDEEAPRPPAESEAPGAEINRLQKGKGDYHERTALFNGECLNQIHKKKI
jgi:hypothetical protein